MARDPDEDFDDEDDLTDDDEDAEGPEVGVTVEIVGLSLYTHHGVTAASDWCSMCASTSASPTR
jgi:hypothetical protein